MPKTGEALQEHSSSAGGAYTSTLTVVALIRAHVYDSTALALMPVEAHPDSEATRGRWCVRQEKAPVNAQHMRNWKIDRL